MAKFERHLVVSLSLNEKEYLANAGVVLATLGTFLEEEANAKNDLVSIDTGEVKDLKDINQAFDMISFLLDNTIKIA